MKALALLLVASTAHAEPTRYVEGGVLFGAADPVIGWNIMPALDAGYRLSEMSWLHGGAGYGLTINNLGTHGPNHGSNALVRGGIEIRWRASASVEVSAGVDLGGAHGTWGPPGSPYSQAHGAVDSISTLALVAIPRFGVEIGSEWRARLGLESDVAIAERESSELAGMTMTAWKTGTTSIELAAGVAHLW